VVLHLVVTAVVWVAAVAALHLAVTVAPMAVVVATMVAVVMAAIAAAAFTMMAAAIMEAGAGIGGPSDGGPGRGMIMNKRVPIIPYIEQICLYLMMQHINQPLKLDMERENVPEIRFGDFAIPPKRKHDKSHKRCTFAPNTINIRQKE
jgi:hypothetical protein